MNIYYNQRNAGTRLAVVYPSHLTGMLEQQFLMNLNLPDAITNIRTTSNDYGINQGKLHLQ